MTPEQFCYWLQGFIETNNPQAMPLRLQWEMIQAHLATVFTKITPTYTTICTPLHLPDPFPGSQTIC
jgi:hypothetical protein